MVVMEYKMNRVLMTATAFCLQRVSLSLQGPPGWTLDSYVCALSSDLSEASHNKI